MMTLIEGHISAMLGTRGRTASLLMIHAPCTRGTAATAGHDPLLLFVNEYLKGSLWVGGTSAICDRRGAPIRISDPKWQPAWPLIEPFWAARFMASAYCGISLWPAAISLKATRHKPLCRSPGRNGHRNGR